MPIPNVGFNVSPISPRSIPADRGDSPIDQAFGQILNFALQRRMQQERQEAYEERQERQRQEATDRYVRRGIAEGRLTPVDRDFDRALPTQMDEPGRTVRNLPGMGPPDPTSRFGRADLESIAHGEGPVSTQEFETSEGEVEVAPTSRIREVERDREMRETVEELEGQGAIPEGTDAETLRMATQLGMQDEILPAGEGRIEQLRSMANTIQGADEILARYGSVENLDNLSQADAAAAHEAMMFQYRLNENLRRRASTNRQNRLEQINLRMQLGQMRLPNPGGERDYRKLSTPEINGVMNALFTPDQLSPEARDQAMQLYDQLEPVPEESPFGDTLATQVLETFNAVSGGPNSNPREFNSMAGVMWGWVRNNKDFLTNVVGDPGQVASREEFRQWLNTSAAIPYRKAYALNVAGSVNSMQQYRELSRLGVPFSQAGVTTNTLQAASELIPGFGQIRGPEGGTPRGGTGGDDDNRDSDVDLEDRTLGPAPGATEPWNTRRVSREAMASVMDSAKTELARSVATRLRRGDEGQVADSVTAFRNAAMQSPDSLISRAQERVSALQDRLENQSDALTELQKSNLQAEIDDWTMIMELLEEDPSLHMDFVNLILDPAIEQGFGMVGRDFTTMRERVAETPETGIESPDTLPEPGGSQ